MKNTWHLTKRNLALFIHNPMNILLSFACIPIVVAMYVLFLKDFMFDAVRAAQIQECYVKEFTNRFMCAGLLTVISTTTCFGIIQTCVRDKENGVIRDFLIAPIQPVQIYLSYAIASAMVSFCYTAFAALLMEVVFLVFGYEVITVKIMLLQMLTILLMSIGNALMFLCFSFFIGHSTTFSTFANLFGTICGFLAGVYLPFSLYPELLQRILLKFYPLQMTSLLRQLSIQGIDEKIGRETGVKVSSEVKKLLGIVVDKQGSIMSVEKQWSVILFSYAALLALITILVERRYSGVPKNVKAHNRS